MKSFEIIDIVKRINVDSNELKTWKVLKFKWVSILDRQYKYELKTWKVLKWGNENFC